MKARLRRLLFLLSVALIAAFSILPFLWFIATSLKTQMEITAIPPTLLPSFSLDFYRSALDDYHLLHYLKNSVIVAGAATAGTIGISLFAGYALARIPLRHKPLIMGSLLLVAMFPQISIAGPVWQILAALGWLNSYQGLILPYITLSLPLGVWIMTGFFRELPQELEDAARVDGCGHLQTLFRIIIPLAAPGVFTAAILVFIYAWNEFFFALLIMTQRPYQTLPVGIALFQGQYTIPWGEIAAASTIATIPLVLLVLLFQRRIVRGLSAGAIKG
ncbi:MAG TPA: carbohydrate ABC transporter permease [Syntrophales bacterium]|nr:carbohydrate ABC transporter permease [Syntrophales bacterium]HOH73163.1 carbohydrate ABC transporter permease [Syntrophales bacterium]HPN08249.1 carbohydrate ABC transporter permease [Syntrophales bacterium]HQK79154.1 carbohydrate ABC transporter permease [Syntrophales bacterium]